MNNFLEKLVLGVIVGVTVVYATRHFGSTNTKTDKDNTDDDGWF